MNVEYLSIEFMKQISHEIPQTLSVWQLTKIRHSLIILKAENKFNEIYFWGRIDGKESNYFIAMGYLGDCITERIYFYSNDCLEWLLLETWNNEILNLNSMAWCRFQGDSSFIHNIEMVSNQINFFVLCFVGSIN